MLYNIILINYSTKVTYFDDLLDFLRIFGRRNEL